MVPLIERLLAKVEVAPSGCWQWTASTRGGYGQIRRGGRSGGVVGAHRAMYECIVGPVTDELDLDHLCRNTMCVNPDHLEPVTRRENIIRGSAPAAANARKTHCSAGHDLGPAAVGRRSCPCKKRGA